MRGSITTPMTIGVNDILVKFNSEGRKIMAYADDVVIFVKGNFYNQLERYHANIFRYTIFLGKG